MAYFGVLSRKQKKAVAALLMRATIRSAAKVAGVSERSIYRWMKSPDFKLALEAARSAGQADTRTDRETLRQVRDNMENPPSARLRAARELLRNEECGRG